MPVAYSSAPMTVDRERGAVVVFRDISEQRRAGTERRRVEAIHASRARLAEAQLEERRRLGRDLHDGAQQRLINVVVALQLLAAHATDAEAKRLIAEAVSEPRQAIEDLRQLAADLHPSVLTHRGLRAAIRSLTARAPAPVTLEIAEERFAPIVEATAYFVVAEPLANVAKHAEASEASVTVADRERLEIAVADDGRGGAAIDRAKGSGLAGLEDRVAAVGGSLAIESSAAGRTRSRDARDRGGAVCADCRGDGSPSVPAPGARVGSAPRADRACGGPSAPRSPDRARIRPPRRDGSRPRTNRGPRSDP